MDGFRQASCVARHRWDIYSPIFSPATFLSLCDILWRHDSLAAEALGESVKRIQLPGLRSYDGLSGSYTLRVGVPRFSGYVLGQFAQSPVLNRFRLKCSTLDYKYRAMLVDEVEYGCLV